jgi:pyridoxine 5-phosphate synthase
LTARSALRLGVNIDHVATVRNARGGLQPDPVRAAKLAERAGADGITAHLREDRRHITDGDITRLMRELKLPLNLEMAATEEMLDIALRHRPHAACIVPERREERTTEGGLDAAGGIAHLKPFVAALGQAGIRVSLFIEADPRQLDAAKRLGAPVVELHTGAYCDAAIAGDAAETERQLIRLREAARHGGAAGLEVHAGHGLTYDTVGPIAALPEVAELNIGHFLIGEAIFVGLEASVRHMRRLMDEARSELRAAAS